MDQKFYVDNSDYRLGLICRGGGEREKESWFRLHKIIMRRIGLDRLPVSKVSCEVGLFKV